MHGDQLQIMREYLKQACIIPPGCCSLFVSSFISLWPLELFILVLCQKLYRRSYHIATNVVLYRLNPITTNTTTASASSTIIDSIEATISKDVINKVTQTDDTLCTCKDVAM